ncbi:acetoacetate decarboxylase family protein [Leptospira licerasiae]|uniref:Acetoacetate decarboxylase-like protein n=1 Tax=Leptospira licerasiae str. MMD4847 TaxID=1049971 RepID=A0ABP2RDI5_9LEPT|nr:acetoacetate decarboxylase family protein [Leptospira licerasiae]EIE02544.1 acetoacetate decarboxylase-like protein [Leptospira licerasiae serovar Varillal str. VAR 010]EJZ42552.1 acetoacetate decarboxylase-like protein [Leptospira licerasiae str. MMD4847]
MKATASSKVKPKTKASKTTQHSPKKATNTKSKVQSPKRHFPAPWSLTGEGFLFPLFGRKSYNLEMAFLDEEDRKSFKGGLGSLMLVNYERSDVGPYYELLYIPGNFEHKEINYKRITRIFVSSQTSVEEGIRNWAIPKERADFVWKKEGSVTKIEVSRNGKTFFKIKIRTLGFNFPVSTSILPYVLLQKAEDGSKLSTAFIGTGKGKFARIESVWSDETIFPDFIKGGGMRTGIGASPFHLTFPVAEHVE